VNTFQQPYPRLPVCLMGGLALLVFGWWFIQLLPDPHPTTIHGRAATAEEFAQINDVVQRAEAIRYPARRTGDVSAFPTIYANDDHILLGDGWYDMLNDDRERADAVLTAAGMALPGRNPGFLTAVAVETLLLHEDGPPYWAGPAKPVTLSEVEVSGNHAGAIVRLSEGGGTFEHYVFTRVDGHWLISSIWTDCDPTGCA
jgi:hypothetical protein